MPWLKATFDFNNKTFHAAKWPDFKTVVLTQIKIIKWNCAFKRKPCVEQCRLKVCMIYIVMCEVNHKEQYGSKCA